MKTKILLLIFAAAFAVSPLSAQPNRGAARSSSTSRDIAVTNDFASDLVTVHDAQVKALDQAKEMLESGEGVRDKAALESAIKQMELAQTALDNAGKSPEKLSAAIAAEQSAYQALLKVTPREYRMQRQRGGQSGQSGQAGQASQRQMNELDMQNEENRYETERQATPPRTAQQQAQQREQNQVADRLKELSQRQQDLNERLRELQTALQAAKTDTEREDIQRQLKRLQDEQRQMLANVDELKQKLADSPNASQQADTQKQLDQARTDMERAAQEMGKDSASQALAAGTRAQQTMQTLRDDLRRQSGSQFSEQMRDLRNQARDLTQKQDEIAQKLDSLSKGEQQALDNSAERKQLVDQMTKQQGALTNLLGEMRTVTEQAESTEPLLSKQLYDTLRRADQMRTENLLQLGQQLTDRGFLPQASQAERAARTNITELARSVERAADSVLGSEADALRYAQSELDDLTRQMQRELAGGGTNAAASGTARNGAATGRNASRNQNTNEVARADGQPGEGNQANAGQNGNRGQQPDGNGTGEQASAQGQQGGQPGQGQQPGQGEGQAANGQRGGRGQQPGNGNGEQASAQGQQSGQEGQGDQPGQGEAQGGRGQRGQRGQQPGSGNGEQASAQDQQNGQEGQGGQGEGQAGNNGQRGNRNGNQQQANNNSPGQRAGVGQRQGGQNAGGQQAGGGTGGDRLRQLAQQLGGRNGGGGNNGPITGGDYVNWADRLRDVEQVLNSPDLRNQLATVRERATALRDQYRKDGNKPDEAAVREQILAPMTQVRVWLQEELARKENVNSLVPLDRDPVPENYSELVQTYYEKLGSAQ